MVIHTEKNLAIYLVSDSTGETVSNVARAAIAHFENINIEEHLWSLVRTRGQIDKLINSLQKTKGIVMYTIANSELQNYLREACAKIQILAIPVLDEVVKTLSTHLQIKPINQAGRQHVMNEEYFSRINAINFALSHDDGQANFDISSADIILVGPSRTSKSPTCIYLAYRGFKAANIPFVAHQNFPEIPVGPFVVGLLINPERLVEVRKNRLLNLNDKSNSSYIDYDKIEQEIKAAKQLYQKNSWPVIDVSRKSVEETAANIIKLYEQFKLGK